MKKMSLAALLIMVGAVVAVADEPKAKDTPKVVIGKNEKDGDKEKDAKPKLGMGDPAPKLAGVRWIKGDPINAFDPKKVYVLEFWATWCGPCIAAMPHLSDLQDEFRAKGLVIAGVTGKEQNSEEDVTKFMAKKGERMRYAVAFCDTAETDAAFMHASDQKGIPCSFVIDRAGKIAYIGHPMMLDDVLPKVLDGTWRGQEDIDAIEKLQTEFFSIFKKAQSDPEGAMKELAEFDAKHPSKKNSFTDQRFILVVAGKKWDDAAKMANQFISKAAAKKDSGPLGLVGYVLANERLNPEKKHVDLAVKAAETALKIDGEDDTRSLLALADAHFASGAKDKALTFGEKALKSTEVKEFKEYIEMKIKVYKGEKEDGPVPAAKVKPAEEKEKKKD